MATKLSPRRISLIAACSAPILMFAAVTPAQTSREVHGVTLPQIQSLEAKKATRTAAQKKVNSLILNTLEAVQSGQAGATASTFKAAGLTPTAEGIEVDISGIVSPELRKKIEDAGGKVKGEYPDVGSIRASIPVDATIMDLANRPDVTQIAPSAQGATNAVAPASEGDIAHTARLARANFNVSGAGIRIGVLSDSIDDADGSLQEAYDSKVLDPNLLTIVPGTEGRGAGEGLAMAEIIHAIAPAAHIYFATAQGGPAAMATNIRRLRQEDNCDIIVDDYTYYIESPFQSNPHSLSGVINQAVNDVSSSGVLYFSSARNSGNLKEGSSGTWEGDFRDGGPIGVQFQAAGANSRVHIFSGRITLNTARVAHAGDRVDLFWSDPLGQSTNDYDLFVVNASGQVVRSATTSHSDGRLDPYQSIPTLHQGESIVIVKSGDAAPRFLHLDTGRAVLAIGTDGSVRGHNASGASNAFSVAAIRVPAPPVPFGINLSSTVEKFSSDGPRRVFYTPEGAPLTPGNLSSTGGILLGKPDLTAADGVSTSLANPEFNPFLGTSAAAPHAAAIAALLLSCDPKPTANQIRTALQGTAIPIEGAVQNVTAGWGIVMANTAASKLCKDAPAAVSGAH